ncbi:MAG: hypothetical protein GY933_16815 [Hyphomicrobiales bacterium]|nr:hypothetical protein [Hyphomicrobiales bacterium]
MRIFLAVAMMVVPVACTDGGAAVPPNYEAPIDRQAFNAFKAAMKSDWLEKPYKIGDPPETMLAIYLQMYSHVNRITETPSTKDPLAEIGINVVDSREPGKITFRSGYLPLARVEEFERQRSVRFTAHVPFSRLLRKDEDPPSSEMRELIAKTRANYFAAEECERLLDSLAKECFVEAARASLDGDTVRIEGYLHFVQKAHFGDLDPKKDWSFSTANLDLTRNPSHTTTRESARDRKALYRLATKQCSEIRKREGNCALSSLWIDERRDTRSGGYKLTARAEYGFLTALD